MATTLIESVASSIAKTGGNRWRVVLAAPGKGHSGTYSREVLERDGAAAIPPNTKAFIKHALPEDRDPRDQFGKYPKGAWYDDTLDKTKYPEGALVADLEVRKNFVDAIEEMGQEAELSMYVKGDVDDEGNIVSLNPYRGNSVDLVAFGGLVGAGVLEKLYESMHSEDTPDDRTSVQVQKENGYKMDEELKKALYALQTSIDSLAAGPKPKTEAETKADFDAAVKAEFDSKASTLVDTALAQVAAIDEAKLLPSMAESLKNDVKAGKDITESLASAKVTMEEFKTTLAESLSSTENVLVNGTASGTESWTVSSVTKAVY